MNFHGDLGFVFLLRNVIIDSQAGLVAISVLVFAVAMVSQCISALHAYSAFVLRMNIRRSKVFLFGMEGVRRRRLLRHIIGSFTYMFQLMLAYLLMLAVSTYHPGILVAAALGITLGYFLTQPLIMQGVDVLHMKQEQERVNATTRGTNDDSRGPLIGIQEL